MPGMTGMGVAAKRRS
ncbi:PTPA-CTERM sorting domain-containing protein [Roseateles sp. BYS96W]|uniref:PTPA-CTERM sorting domain-containing protein n=1 Tax=Pelomonas nitida TaxID=3299027 RepID=A0ABW7GCV1_9BURK